MLDLVLGFGLPGGAEWIIILVIALLIFGSKLPSIMRGLGGSIKEFKKGMSDDAPTQAPPAPPAPGGYQQSYQQSQPPRYEANQPAGSVSRDPQPPSVPPASPR